MGERNGKGSDGDRESHHFRNLGSNKGEGGVRGVGLWHSRVWSLYGSDHINSTKRTVCWRSIHF